MRNAAIAIIVLAFFALNGCSGTPDNYVQQSQAVPTQPATPVVYPPGEYLTTAKATPAADTAVDLALAIKAIGRNDLKSIRTLHGNGVLFNLPKGTRLILLPAEANSAQLRTSVVGTIDNVPICIATVESGDRIGTDVALGCGSLSSAIQ